MSVEYWEEALFLVYLIKDTIIHRTYVIVINVLHYEESIYFRYPVISNRKQL